MKKVLQLNILKVKNNKSWSNFSYLLKKSTWVVLHLNLGEINLQHWLIWPIKLR